MQGTQKPKNGNHGYPHLNRQEVEHKQISGGGRVMAATEGLGGVHCNVLLH